MSKCTLLVETEMAGQAGTEQQRLKLAILLQQLETSRPPDTCMCYQEAEPRFPDLPVSRLRSLIPCHSLPTFTTAAIHSVGVINPPCLHCLAYLAGAGPARVNHCIIVTLVAPFAPGKSEVSQPCSSRVPAPMPMTEDRRKIANGRKAARVDGWLMRMFSSSFPSLFSML